LLVFMPTPTFSSDQEAIERFADRLGGKPSHYRRPRELQTRQVINSLLASPQGVTCLRTMEEDGAETDVVRVTRDRIFFGDCLYKVACAVRKTGGWQNYYDALDGITQRGIELMDAKTYRFMGRNGDFSDTSTWLNTPEWMLALDLAKIGHGSGGVSYMSPRKIDPEVGYRHMFSVPFVRELRLKDSLQMPKELIAKPTSLCSGEQLESGIEWGDYAHVSEALRSCAVRDISAGRIKKVTGLYPDSVPRDLSANVVSQRISRLMQAIQRAVTFVVSGKASPVIQQVEYLHQTLQELGKMRSFAETHLNFSEHSDTGQQVLARYQRILHLILPILPKLEVALEMQDQEPVRLDCTEQLLLSEFCNDETTREFAESLEQEELNLDAMRQAIAELSGTTTKE
jgi:hypothetical protein